MALDLSKLTDAVTKVASLAQSHAAVVASHTDTSGALAAAVADADVLRLEITSAQADIDKLTETLLAACTSPAEAVGLVAVAAALEAPVSATALVAPPVSAGALGAIRVDPLSVIYPTITPAPVSEPVDIIDPTPLPAVTLLPAVDFAPAAPQTLEELNAHIARQNANAPSATN